MRRRIPWAMVALVMLAVPAPANAASVSIVNFAFTPDIVTIEQGDSVTWTNDGSVGHSSTQDAPLGLWDSLVLPAGDSFEVMLPAAGTYPYHCKVHPTLMTGTIKVPLIVDQTTGTTDTSFTFTLASDLQGGFVYDVQKKKGKGIWKDWKMGVAGPTVAFNPNKTGTFRFRSRLHRSSDDALSGYSPKKKVHVSAA